MYDIDLFDVPQGEFDTLHTDGRVVICSFCGVRDVMRARLDVAVLRGCDGVEPDNVDGYANNNGLGLSRADQLDYNRFLADEAHVRNLSVGLKNATDLVSSLEPYFDWALNEECVSYNECNTLQPFISAGKAVFHTGYVDREDQAQELADDLCGDPQRQDLETLVKTWDLDTFRLACP